MTIDTFAPHLGETFRGVVNDEQQMHMTRAGAASLVGKSSSARRPLALVFRAPLETIVARQVFRVEHDVMPPMDIFLVSLGADAEGMRYPAVFTSRL